MYLTILFTLFLPILGALAIPLAEGTPLQVAETCTEESSTSSTTLDSSISSTLPTTTTTIISVSETITSTVDPTAGSTSTAPITYPTLAFTVIAARSGSPIHLLSVNAAGQAFYIGGESATYCPLTNQTECPPGDVTAFLGSGYMDAEVPGGQIVFVAPDGHVGFTQAHSAYYPPGSVLGPFTYSKEPGASFGSVSTQAFGATGFMACKGNGTGTYQVFANLLNATVPTQNISDCLGFDPLTSGYTSGFAAWQYI